MGIVITPGSKAICHAVSYDGGNGADTLLSGFCQMFVPMKVSEIGLNSWEQIQTMQEEFLPLIGQQMRQPGVSEAIIFGGEVSRELATSGRMQLIQCLALLSFVEGGVRFGGIRYTSEHDDAPYRNPASYSSSGAEHPTSKDTSPK